ncbi:MAG: hypothetical protein U9N55_05280 [candidate division Zixibacteria bacterium]|nr:hypothetical protein [candidate division Zixibacteria bacterium]
MQRNYNATNKKIGDLTEMLDRFYPNKMIFIHHSVGKNILYEGGLKDSLAKLGILVKSSTYGDEIGEKTDMCNWLPKFEKDMDRILSFKAHPNMYYNDGTTNDIVMFKSCFPNSYVIENTGPGDPTDQKRTIANFKAIFEGLKDEMRKHKTCLFVYLTAPPLVSEATTTQHAARARDFNDWLKGEFYPRYSKETGHGNFVVFDLFGFLTDEDNFLKKEYRTGNAGDSHPNVVANEAVTVKFMEFFHPIWQKWQKQSTIQEQNEH